MNEARDDFFDHAPVPVHTGPDAVHCEECGLPLLADLPQDGEPIPYEHEVPPDAIWDCDDCPFNGSYSAADAHHVESRHTLHPAQTKSGKILTMTEVEAWAREAEQGYDVDKIVPTIIGRERALVTGVTKLLIDAAKKQHEWTKPEETPRGSTFRLNLFVDNEAANRTVKVTIEMEPPE